MHTKDSASWHEFKESLNILNQERDGLKKERYPGVRISEFLYRGHSDSEWKLETTLERFPEHSLSVENYYRLIHKIKLEVETYFKKEWVIPDADEWIEKLNKKSYSNIATYIVNSGSLYEYIVFLRHHGFPSPLLDWSRSPYVAAFFATRQAIVNKSKFISIFVFLDSIGKGKQYIGDLGNGIQQIEALGPNVRGQKRHFLQQCEYTICTQSKPNEYKFISHEEIVGTSNVIKFRAEKQTQDFIFKFNMRYCQMLWSEFLALRILPASF